MQIACPHRTRALSARGSGFRGRCAELYAACGAQHFPHEPASVGRKPAVVLSIGEGDARQGQPQRVGFPRQLHTVVRARQDLADHLEPCHEVVVRHPPSKVHPEGATVVNEGRREVGRQRPLAHESPAAGEVLPVLVVPVFADGHAGRPLVPADLLGHPRPDRVVRMDHEVPPDEPRPVRETGGMGGCSRVEEEAGRLDGVARDNRRARPLEPPAPPEMVVESGRATVPVGLDSTDHGEVADLGPGGKGTGYVGVEHALRGVRRAPDLAEAAVDAGRLALGPTPRAVSLPPAGGECRGNGACARGPSRDRERHQSGRKRSATI
jgi:hypothetical protein